MIFKGPPSEAKLIEEKTGVSTVAAVDGMLVIFGEEIRIETRLKRIQQGLNKFI